MKRDVRDPYKDFSTLSFKDLVDARDFYHRQLMRKLNVIGTALGRYLQRKDGVGKNEKKTIFNTEVRENSWPCLLVFVDKWVTDADFGMGKKQISPAQYIPPSIEMPDGRVVPLCVVEAAQQFSPERPVSNPVFPSNWIGGGYPVIADVQNEEHIASIGGLVTDGHLLYAITNRHVTGGAGEIVYSIINGERVAIGRSARKQVTRMPFSKAYPDWPGKDTFIHMDIGLIEVEDATRWTSQVYGIGAVGHMIDLNTDNFSLRLIDCPLRAFGCASGHMNGKLLGMFYRYKAISGSEYVADFIIGPNGTESFTTQHGDSGTLWLLQDDESKLLLPLAVQWGGAVLGGEETPQPFALATNLSTVCRELDVDFISDLNSGQFEYWGAVGHYTIAEFACNLVQDSHLRSLMQANAENITFPEAEINGKNMKGLSNQPFVPLADVPDMVWKVGPYKRGGMTSPEHSNHFADMDKKDSSGQTLLDLCEASDANITPARWLKYYKDPKVKDKSNGLLPFRCWQIYQEMVDAVSKRDATRFVCAAGILSHYVGDACQPLHISYMFNGDPAHTETVAVTKKGVTSDVIQPVAKGVHSAYEDGLVNLHAIDIHQDLHHALDGKTHGLPLNTQSGFGAAKAVVHLMSQTFNVIEPAEIVKAFVPIRKMKPKQVADKLWNKFGPDTEKVLAKGAKTLAMLWDSAWKEGGGDASLAGKGEIPSDDLKKLYINPSFLKSYTLAQIGPALKTSGTAAPKRKPAKAAAKPHAKGHAAGK